MLGHRAPQFRRLTLVHNRSNIVPSDKPASRPDVFNNAANGATAGSYLTDGRFNIGGWSTYPSADQLELNAKARQSPANQGSPRK